LENQFFSPDRMIFRKKLRNYIFASYFHNKRSTEKIYIRKSPVTVIKKYFSRKQVEKPFLNMKPFAGYWKAMPKTSSFCNNKGGKGRQASRKLPALQVNTKTHIFKLHPSSPLRDCEA